MFRYFSYYKNKNQRVLIQSLMHLGSAPHYPAGLSAGRPDCYRQAPDLQPAFPL
jgi:hypothetical protein